MADYPAFPLWTDAYLADTMHLTEAEHGLYLLMLIHLWRAPKQRFPNDDEWLARKFGKTLEQVQTELRPLIKEFLSTDGNWLYQKRLQREFEYVRRKSQNQSDRAKRRWNKDKPLSRGNAAPHMPRACGPAYTKKSAPAKSLQTNGNAACRGNAPTPTPPTTRDDTFYGDSQDRNPGRGTQAETTHARARQGSRLPREWVPSDIDAAYARKVGVNPDTAGEDFRDYWTAKAGAQARKTDWAATWRLWCRREAERKKPERKEPKWEGIL